MEQLTVEGMQERFWAATAEKELLDARTAPLKKERDDLVTKYQPMETAIRELGRKIREMESPQRAHLDAELSMIARALGNRVGERPAGR